jgi:hypothetical protein
MKNLKNLGKALTRDEQEMITGGRNTIMMICEIDKDICEANGGYWEGIEGNEESCGTCCCPD